MFIDKFSSFFSDTPKCELLQWIARRIFYRFWKTVFQSCRIFGRKSISAIYNVLGAITQPPAQIEFYFYEMFHSSHQLRICSHVNANQMLLHAKCFCERMLSAIPRYQNFEKIFSSRRDSRERSMWSWSSRWRGNNLPNRSIPVFHNNETLCYCSQISKMWLMHLDVARSNFTSNVLFGYWIDFQNFGTWE